MKAMTVVMNRTTPMVPQPRSVAACARKDSTPIPTRTVRFVARQLQASRVEDDRNANKKVRMKIDVCYK